MLWSQVEKIEITGRILDVQNGRPLFGAMLLNEKLDLLSTSDFSGYFYLSLKEKEKRIIQVRLLGYQPLYFSTDTIKGFLSILLNPSPVLTRPIEILSVRHVASILFAQNDLAARDFENKNLGQDIPILLNNLPATVAGSDAGNGIGYTNLRIRGTDITRTNVTIDGVPVNDAESQGVFWVNMPDLISSAGSLQVQRGVGPSTNGPGAYGASIHISTLELRENPYAELGASYGSFNSSRISLKAGTGLLNNKFCADVRLSDIRSQGYVDRASSKLNSWFSTLSYYGKKTTIKANVFSGKEKTYQAWYGIPTVWSDSARRANVAGTERPESPYDNETDNYHQTWYRLLVNQTIIPSLSLNAGAFAVNGAGYYEQYKAEQNLGKYRIIGGDTLPSTDLIRQLWLKNWFYGGMFNLMYSSSKAEIIWGNMISRYDGIHEGRVIWSQNGFVPDNHLWYYHKAFKTDLNSFLKTNVKIYKNWDLYGDIQFRWVNYQIDGFRNNPQLRVDKKFPFVNPKIGVSWMPFKGHHLFLSAAVASKEPNRDDFEAGIHQAPRAERLIDYELGYHFYHSSYSLKMNGFLMDYYNQLVLTGRINDVGAYTRQNVPRSYRAGIEFEGKWQVIKMLEISGNLHLARHRIVRFTEFIDNEDTGFQDSIVRENSPIALSPAIISNLSLILMPFKGFTFTFNNKFVGAQYLDNSGEENARLPGFFVADAILSYERKFTSSLSVLWNIGLFNITNTLYAPSGYTYPYIFNGSRFRDSYIYPMAPFNVMGGVTLKFRQ